MPIRAHTRRDPQQGKKGFSTNKGFTVIELMIALAVLAVLTSLAFPSYRAILEKRQVTKGAEQFNAFLSLAKSSAVKLNEDVAISYSKSGNDWCMGFSNGQDACDCADPSASNYCEVEYDYDRDGDIDAVEPRVFVDSNFSDPATLSSITFADSDGDALSGSPVLVYDSIRGMLEINDAGSQAAQATLALVSKPDGKYAINVVIDRLGRVSVCSPSSGDHLQVPGYDTC